MKRILILTADYGYGHRSAANAIAAALQVTYPRDCQVEIVNPMEDPRAPSFLRENQSNYDRLVRELPELWKLGYQVSDTQLATSLIKTSWTLMLYNVLRDIIRQKQPDIIVSTYPSYLGIIDAVFTLENLRLPLITVVTDLETVKSIWFHSVTDLCLVPTQAVYNLAVEAGLPPEKVRITGIPVRPELAAGAPDKASLRLSQGWRPDLFTVLAIGSKRVEHLYDSVRVLNHCGYPLQLVVVSGGDEEQFRRFQETEWHIQTYCYDFVQEMGAFMQAADCIVSKAGGLIVSEALAAGLPLILIDVIPGQETGNADHVVNGHAGVLARDPIEVLEAMCHWLENDCLRYHQAAENARQLGRPQAAFEIAGLVWAAAIPS